MAPTEKVDPITMSVIFHRIQAINREMGVTMTRTSKSPIFAEVHDFSCAICDWKPWIVSQIEGVPSHTASSMLAAKAIKEEFKEEMHNGDVFLMNDPYMGGTHLADITVVKPIYCDDELIFMAINRAHHIDVGGLSAGSYSPLATEIFHEGIRIPPVRIFKNNKPIKDVLNLIKLNTRLPEMLLSDIKAQVASCNVAEKRVLEMLEKFGVETMKGAVERIHEYSEERMRHEISKIPDGIYEGASYLDYDGVEKENIAVKVKITIAGDEMIVDFKGTDPQTRGFINSPYGNTLTCVYAAILTVIGKDVPHTEGSYRPIKIIAPKGSLVNPGPPAPVADSTLDTACAILEAMWIALSKAIPDRVPAGWYRWCGPAIAGIDPRNGEYYVMYAFNSMGGAGASPYMDGLSYMSDGIDLGGLIAPNIETNEVQYPHITEFHEFLEDSGGIGKYRGGLGVKYKIKLYDESPELIMFGDGKVNSPYGLYDGGPGSSNKPILNEDTHEEKELPSKGFVRAKKGSTYTIYSSGGGGWGNPLERDPEKVRLDVLNGFVSLKSAREDYGVALSEDLQINWEETKVLREKLKRRQ